MAGWACPFGAGKWERKESKEITDENGNKKN